MKTVSSIDSETTTVTVIHTSYSLLSSVSQPTCKTNGKLYHTNYEALYTIHIPQTGLFKMEKK